VTTATIPPSLPNLFAFDEGVALHIGATPGWKRGAGSVVIEQPKIGVVVRWVHWAAGGQYKYDQVLRAEKPGALFLPVADGKMGLIKQWRPQAADMDVYERQFPDFDLANLGRESWEAPRGFRIPGQTAEQTAKIEAEKETGGRLLYQQGLHPGCDNTTFSPHFTYMSFGSIDLSKPTKQGDPLEIILSKVTWYTLADLNDLEAAGTYYCNYTAAAIERLLRRYPGTVR
jgi:hypothetical protein